MVIVIKLAKGFLVGEFFLIRIKGLRIENTCVCCTVYKAS